MNLPVQTAVTGNHLIRGHAVVHPVEIALLAIIAADVTAAGLSLRPALDRLVHTAKRNPEDQGMTTNHLVRVCLRQR